MTTSEPTTLRCVALVKAASDHPKIISGELPAFSERCGLPLVRAAEGPCEEIVVNVHSHRQQACAQKRDGFRHIDRSFSRWHAYLGPWTHYTEARNGRVAFPMDARHTPVPESEPIDA